MASNSNSCRQLTYGMIGGGAGGFIGDVHRRAVALDGKARLAAGCFSSNYDNTLATGQALDIPRERLYENYKEMAAAESVRADKLDFISIVTPNYLHYEVAKAFLQIGINVVCDKPLTIEVWEAQELARIAKENDLLFCVTYTYVGYPMAAQAREMIRNGDIGEVKVVMAEYISDWFAKEVQQTGDNSSMWRMNPAKVGKASCLGDIGSHTENMVSYMTGLKITKLMAVLDNIGQNVPMDTSDSIMLKYDNGATGMYWACQVAAGYENDLRVRIFGDKGTIEWSQFTPDVLKVTMMGQPTQLYTSSNKYLYPAAQELCRVPSGHPEGYYNAFANVYDGFITSLIGKKEGNGGEKYFPDVDDGIYTLKFIEKCLESNSNGSAWVEFNR